MPRSSHTQGEVIVVPSTIPITPPPDGGTQAYLQILGSLLAMGSAWGTISTWGVCQTYYTSTLLPQYPQSTISWIGSLQVTLIFLIGIFSGRLADAGYYYPLTFGGFILQVIGLMMTSISRTFWQLLLSQGLCFGLGIGLAFPPVATLLSTYFEKKRALALSIAASGTGVTGLVFPSVIRELLPTAGFGWAMRTVAFLVLACNLGAALLLRWRLPPRTTGPWIDYSAFKDRTYVFGVSGMFFVFWSLYFAFFYVGVFARTEIGLSYTSSIDLLLVMIGIGIPSRIIPGYLADRYTGPMNLQLPFIAYTGVMLLCWIAVHDATGLYIFSALYGISGAGIQGLFPAMLSGLAPDVRFRGTRMGMGFFVVSFAVFSGPPIAGALISKRDGNFLYAQIWAGLSMFVGFALLLTGRISRTGLVLKARI
ncbi:hypothetical protein ANO11243_037490 [Dothideomycetidae sp. 11243]|nr:hypothetical protein ANO11243_037490 [fungal sp. No.11243]